MENGSMGYQGGKAGGRRRYARRISKEELVSVTRNSMRACVARHWDIYEACEAPF